MQRALVIGRQAQPQQWGSLERVYWRFLAAIRRETGQPDEIEQLVDPLTAQIPTDSTWFDANRNIRGLLTVLYCDIGRLEEARAEFERLASEGFVDIAHDPLWLSTMIFLAESCVQLQDRPRANSLYAFIEPFAGLNVVNHHGHICYGSAAYYLGLLATTLSRWDDAERHFAEALAMNERMGARPFIAHTQNAWAEMLVQRGQPGDTERALDLAHKALAIAEETGMTRLSARTRPLIAALKEKTSTVATARNLAYGLSPRELDVLRLLVDGRSDREIAASLYISHRTVMTHVANILNKLGVASRTAAASQAVREGIV